MKGLVEFSRQSLGLELWPGQADILTGWAASGKRKLLVCAGRRSGKDLIGAVGAIHNATVPDYSGFLRRGERRFIVVVANRQEQAGEFVRTVQELIHASPDAGLKALIDEKACTADEVRFKSNVTIRAMPCSSRSTRGLAISLLLMNEAAAMQTETEGFAAGRAVYRALLPSTAQFKQQGYVMVLSSPLWQAGIFWDLYQAGTTGRDPELHVEQKATWEANPNIRRADLEAEFLADPESAASEFGAVFGSGQQGAYLDPDSVYACVIKGRRSLPFLPGATYVSAADPAFAAGGDAFAVAVAHVEYQEELDGSESKICVLDRLQTWRGRNSPLNSDLVLDEISQLLAEYRLRTIASDQYCLEPLRAGLLRRGVELIGQPLTSELKADVFGALKRSINLQHLELLDHPGLLSELLSLQIRPSPAGKPRIQASGRDDMATVVATVTHAISQLGMTAMDNYPVASSVGASLVNFG